MKLQFFVTHTIHQTDLLFTRKLGYKHTFHQNVSTENFLSSHSCKNITCLSAGLLRICVCVCKTVYWWVMKSFCFMSSIYLEGVYRDSKIGVSCLVASEDVAIKINLPSHHICILVPLILFPPMPLWPVQG
jgi:hypothetical protein